MEVVGVIVAVAAGVAAAVALSAGVLRLLLLVTFGRAPRRVL